MRFLNKVICKVVSSSVSGVFILLIGSQILSCGQSQTKESNDVVHVGDSKVGEWRLISSDGAPEARYLYPRHTVTTPDEIVIFGGYNADNEPFLDGGVYNVKQKIWKKIKTLPEKRENYSTAWANEKLLIWGGSTDSSPTSNTGWIYDLKTEKWTASPTEGAPSPRYITPAYVRGSKVVIWGGHPNCDKVDGAIFDFSTASWTPMASAPMSITAGCSNQFWTKEGKLIVWGGYNENDGATLSGGALFDLATNSWQEITKKNAPSEREWPLLFAFRDTLLVWGGKPKGDYQNEHPFHDGGLYNFSTETWTPISDSSSEVPTLDPSAILLENESVFVWGGSKSVYVASSIANRGGILNLKKSTWEPTTVDGAPSARTPNIIGVTGSMPFVWGGYCLNDGGAFDPLKKEWSKAPGSEVPAPRSFSLQALIGDTIFIWGGKPCNKEKRVYGDGYLVKPF